MRTIKFRGKVEGVWWHVTPEDFNWEQFWACVDKETVGQYIEEKDKHDADIYEGDIVRTRGGYSGIPVFFIEHIEDIHAFCGECGINGDNPKDVEVIGNVYENPKLLQECAQHERD